MANLNMHDLGHVDSKALAREVDHAERMLKEGLRALQRGEHAHAMNEFFRAGAVGVNVIFTAKTHQTSIPKSDLDRCKKVIELSTDGIKKMMKLISYKKVKEHESAMHKKASGKPLGRKKRKAKK